MNAGTTSATLSLNSMEASVLREVLDEALRNLKEELGKTENYDWRQMMHERENILAGLLARMPASSA